MTQELKDRIKNWMADYDILMDVENSSKDYDILMDVENSSKLSMKKVESDISVLDINMKKVESDISILNCHMKKVESNLSTDVNITSFLSLPEYIELDSSLITVTTGTDITVTSGSDLSNS
jgi:hypothetical protein